MFPYLLLPSLPPSIPPSPLPLHVLTHGMADNVTSQYPREPQVKLRGEGLPSPPLRTSMTTMPEKHKVRRAGFQAGMERSVSMMEERARRRVGGREGEREGGERGAKKTEKTNHNPSTTMKNITYLITDSAVEGLTFAVGFQTTWTVLLGVCVDAFLANP